MAEFTLSKQRSFSPTDLSAPTLLVVPDGAGSLPCVRELRQAIAARGRLPELPELMEQRDFRAALFRDFQVIACGHLGDNAAVRRLYTARCCFADTFFPGPGGYFIKSISDPFGHGKNCIALGASSAQDLPTAIEVFIGIVRRSQGALGRVHAHRFSHPLPPLPDETQLEQMIQEALSTWGGGWNASPFRDSKLKDYLWYYYLTDHPVWGRAIPPIFAGSLAPWQEERRAHPETYHCFFNLHHFIHLWDLIEDSPLYTDTDRRQVVEMFSALLRHLAGLFYLREEVNPPGDLRQNHSTFISLSLAAGHEYLSRRYGIGEFAPAAAAAARIFAGQAACYKPDDDAGVGYAWLVPEHTLHYLLSQDDYRYIDEGHVARLCALAAVTTDNMGSEASYGDSSGYAAFSAQGWGARLWPPLVSLWHKPDPGHLWLLNWLGQGKRPSLSHVLNGLYAAVDFTPGGFALEGCAPQSPAEFLGICALPLPEPARNAVARRVPQAHRPEPQRLYFDKLSLRRSFDPQDEYLLLEGVGAFCHGHEDTQAILRLTWKDRAWLADGDYIRAAPKFHNSIAICRDGAGVLESPGEGVVIPPLAALNYQSEGPIFGLLQTETPQYNGMNWQRHIFWRKGRYFFVLDRLRCQALGQYECRCLWRLVGQVESQDARTRLLQQGEEFFIHNADGADQEIAADLHEGGLWTGYPHADKVIRVLLQKRSRALSPGEDLAFANLLTPHPEIHLERLGELLARVRDGQTITVLGAGTARLGGVEIEGEMFALSLDGETLSIQGVERVQVETAGRSYREEFQGACRILDLRSPVGRHLLQALENTPAQPPAPPPPPVVHPVGGLRRRWQRRLSPLTAVAVGQSLVAGTGENQVVHLSLEDGSEQWTSALSASALLLADVDGDGADEVLAGTTDSHLVLLKEGQALWQRPLQNISGRGARVSALAVADLEGSGRMSVLAGTAGWYVNAFAADGTPLWANWFRYHPITALAAVDADRDGKAEVMAGNVYSTPLTVHNWDGSFRWSTLEQVGAEGNSTTPRRGICLNHLCLWDADQDGLLEIAYGTADGWIYAVRPREGAEVWRFNVVGEVKGLIPLAGGLVAASEFGDLYCFTPQGRVRWRAHTSAWIHHLALVGHTLVLAVENGLLLCDLEGRCIGSLSLESQVRGLWACRQGVVAHLAEGWLSCLEIAPV